LEKGIILLDFKVYIYLIFNFNFSFISEFKYDLDTAPQGHLPLTSALRGTQLLKQLMILPVWNKYDWKNYKNIKWEP
jgi:hypothetical protein